MPTVLTTQSPTLNTVGGGNLGLFVQIKQNTDGSFAALSGTDVLGDPAGTVHILGSQVESGATRDEKGQYLCPVTIIEDDGPHQNMLEALAPYNPKDDNPEDLLEDNTIIGGTNSVFGDVLLPYFLFVLFRQPLGGKERARVFIGQFKRAGGSDPMKAKTRNKFKFTIYSVDGQGYVATTLPTHARTASMTGPTLSGNYAQGQLITATE